MKKQKVYLGLSGGVDSSVAAALLLEQGYDVTPVFMKCWSPESSGISYAGDCPWEADLRDALAVAAKLGIGDNFKTWNFEPEYFEYVLQPYFEETRRGLTPNPDITCNQTIKFGKFFERALEEGADFIATGHYARVRKTPDGATLLPALCEPKNDQTYFLYRLTQEQLSRTLFPIGEFGPKSRVREHARYLGFAVSDKRSTRGICFVGKGNYGDLIAHAVETRPGPIMTTAGKVIGEHEGVARYTLGQSKGLGIRIHGGPYYVVEKDMERNALVVAPPAESWKLWHNELVAGDPHWISGRAPELPMRAAVAVRHPQKELAYPCVIEREADNAVKVRLDEEQWALAPGQSVVFYDVNKETVLGGGIIQ